MTRILVTAFEPYGKFAANSSWLALMEFVKELPHEPEVTTRLYPVDFAAVRDRLTQDLARDYDFALHLGQSPGESQVVLEAVGLNVRSPARGPSDAAGAEGQFGSLTEDGPLAYRSELPLAALAERLRAEGMPARVSHHAGTFVCNATLYLSHYLAERMALRTRIGFVHLPLESAQVAAEGEKLPSLPATLMAAAIRELLYAMCELTEVAAVND